MHVMSHVVYIYYNSYKYSFIIDQFYKHMQ